VSFKEAKHGGWKIFHDVEPGIKYSLGADVAEGLAQGDSSTAFIVDQNLKHVASYCGKIAPDLFGEMLCRAGNEYNNALLVVEINNHGILTLDRIKRRNYPNVYTRKVEEIPGEELQKKIGWQTTEKTKYKALDEFVANYRDKKLIIDDIDLLREMGTLVVEDNGKIILNGKDMVVAAMLSLQGIEQMVMDGEFKAFTPADKDDRNLYKISTEERVKRLSRKQEFSSFE